jgi:hypothetical protein
MSGLRSLFGGKSGPTVTPDYTGLQVQTAVNALPIPIVWGVNKIAPNLIWYDNFRSVAQTSGSGGKGGGSGGGNVTGYTYYADIIMALCEGPIEGINQIWRGQSDYTLAQLGLSLFLGNTPQAPWSYLVANYPNQALAYQGTAYVAAAGYALGDSATLDNHSFEVQSAFYGTGTNGLDADPSQVINDLLTNQQYGTVSPTGTAIAVDSTTLFGSGGDASLQTYCAAVGICLSPALTDQEKASSILQRWLQICNIGPVWSGGLLRFIPYGDTEIVAGTVEPITQERQIPENAPPSGTFPQIVVTAPARFVADEGVSYSLSDVALTNTGTAPTGVGTYGINPPGTYLFAPNDSGAEVTISYQYSVAASFVPAATPIYDLDDDDFVYEDNEDPVQVTRSDPYQAYNVWRMEAADRDNAYNLTTVESRDQNAIELYGMRIAPTFTAHEVCDPEVGLLSGQLMLQRSVYIRNTYKFRLSQEYCLLDPMDLVTVTDPLLGLSNTPVRITDIEEDDNGLLDVTAEEFPIGYATATLYATQPTTNNPINRNYAPDTVNPPVIFEPPSALASGQVWIAASGGSGGAVDPLWGGCFVWISLDGATYQNVGKITSPARQGAITANLASFSGTNPDTADTLSVNLSESGGTLASASDIAAQLGQTLCMVDSELLSYGTATLVSGNSYNLTDLYRGLYGTTAAAHTSGAQFVRLDGAIFEYTLPAQFVNQEFYVKLQSFNVFGGGVQDLSTCTAYSVVAAGTTEHPEAAAMNTGANQDLGTCTETVGTHDDFGTPFTLSVSVTVDLGNSV